MKLLTAYLGCATAAFFLLGCTSHQPTRSNPQTIAKALSFHASFDRGLDADAHKGDGRMYWAASMKHPRTGTPGLPPTGAISIAAGEGKFGHALRFHKKVSELPFYKAAGNFPHSTARWSGAFSVWLRTGTDSDLAMGYTDPVQITPREWNDASFFLEFERRKDDTPFRLGAYADFKVWNPDNRKWDDIPASEKPLITVNPPPIKRDQWMHAAVVFENLNTGAADGVIRLYVNGQLSGSMPARVQTFTWDLEKTLMMLGIGYVGWLDEFSVFERALTDDEVRVLASLPKPLATYLPR